MQTITYEQLSNEFNNIPLEIQIEMKLYNLNLLQFSDLLDKEIIAAYDMELSQ